MFLDSGYLLPKYIYIKVSQASQSNEKLGGIHGIKKADRWFQWVLSIAGVSSQQGTHRQALGAGGKPVWLQVRYTQRELPPEEHNGGASTPT